MEKFDARVLAEYYKSTKGGIPETTDTIAGLINSDLLETNEAVLRLVNQGYLEIRDEQRYWGETTHVIYAIITERGKNWVRRG